MQDSGFTFANARRRSNSSAQGLADFKTKFETAEPEPVFEEQIHGPPAEDIDGESVTDAYSNSAGEELGKVA